MISKVMGNLCRGVVHNCTESLHTLLCFTSTESNSKWTVSRVTPTGYDRFAGFVALNTILERQVLLNAAMVRWAAITVFVVVANVNAFSVRANGPMDQSQDQSPKAEPKQKADSKGQSASLTGCVDEQEGKWVLVNNQTMAIIANLTPDGFPGEAFAKYVGHKVTVRGTANSNGSKSEFKVREIESVSDTCTAR